ncbi:hypothetical protein C8J57DRAFT_1471572 [Mycena rebaudengoi]|nr:hypothetical protein C8J57DRAFT_1471572 [Mycena rebaudengoi]
MTLVWFGFSKPWFWFAGFLVSNQTKNITTGDGGAADRLQREHGSADVPEQDEARNRSHYPIQAQLYGVKGEVPRVKWLRRPFFLELLTSTAPETRTLRAFPRSSGWQSQWGLPVSGTGRLIAHRWAVVKHFWPGRHHSLAGQARGEEIATVTARPVVMVAKTVPPRPFNGPRQTARAATAGSERGRGSLGELRAAMRERKKVEKPGALASCVDARGTPLPGILQTMGLAASSRALQPSRSTEAIAVPEVELDVSQVRPVGDAFGVEEERGAPRVASKEPRRALVTAIHDTDAVGGLEHGAVDVAEEVGPLSHVSGEVGRGMEDGYLRRRRADVVRDAVGRYSKKMEETGHRAARAGREGSSCRGSAVRARAHARSPQYGLGSMYRTQERRRKKAEGGEERASAANTAGHEGQLCGQLPHSAEARSQYLNDAPPLGVIHDAATPQPRPRRARSPSVGGEVMAARESKADGR